MTASEIDAIVRNVIVHHGLPFTVLSVTESPAGWNIEVRDGADRLLRFAIPHGRPTATRTAIQEHLEAGA
jgi:hypothetical protein